MNIRSVTCFAMVFALLLVVFTAEDSFSSTYRRQSGSFMKPQAGFWFGPVTPLFELQDQVSTALGGGAFFRRNTAFDPLKLGVDASYQKHGSDGVNGLTLIPIYGNAVFLLPIDFPLHFQFKLGGGAVRVSTKPDERNQWDPLLMSGFEVSFPAGRLVNFGIRIDYMVIYEQRIDGSRYNGYLLNSGLTIYLNI